MRLRALALIAMLASCSRPLDLVATAQDAGVDVLRGADSSSPGVDASKYPVPADGGVDAAMDAITLHEAGKVPGFACAGDASVLLLGAKNTLFALDPRTDEATMLGVIESSELAGGASIISLTIDAEGHVYYLLDYGAILIAQPDSLTSPTTWISKTPSPEGQALAFVGPAGAEEMIAATSNGVFAAKSPAFLWDLLGTLPSPDAAQALLGTGDGRLFGVLSPLDDKSYRVARLDVTSASEGATVYVPATNQPATSPAGFALWGDELLIFEQALVRYDFSTGDLGAPEPLAGILFPVTAAASPACASAFGDD